MAVIVAFVMGVVVTAIYFTTLSWHVRRRISRRDD